MENEPNEGASTRPSFFRNINGWLGGLTGLVVAVSGLLVAWQQLKPPERADAPAVAAIPVDDVVADDATAEEETVEAVADVALPLTYKAVGATFAKVDGEWVYTSATEKTRYKEVSRDGGNTVVFDPEREVYARWPNKGGKVEEKGGGDQAEWEHSFDIWVPRAV
jgi:general stress protein YciG